MKVRRWNTPCRSFTSSKKMDGSKLTVGGLTEGGRESTEANVCVAETITQHQYEREQHDCGRKLPQQRDQVRLAMPGDGHQHIGASEGGRGRQGVVDRHHLGL